MSNAQNDLRIDYIEFPAIDATAARRFYEQAFDWKFTSYGPTYEAFEDGRLGGGLQADDSAKPKAPLVVLYAVKLEAARDKIKTSGGIITQDIYSFPGGRRFHFSDPSGNELAVWSE